LTNPNANPKKLGYKCTSIHAHAWTGQANVKKNNSGELTDKCHTVSISLSVER